MRIGVICEGPTDFVVIKEFFASCLSELQITAQLEFESIQPRLDATQPNGGWGNVLLWLKNNPPASRVANYFQGGPFGGDLKRPSFDLLLIHIDSDILGEDSFERFIKENYNFDVGNPTQPSKRAETIIKVVEIVADIESLNQVDKDRHLVLPAVESTESWCIAAFSTPGEDFELVRGQELIDRFMTCLERSESRDPKTIYHEINKDVKRRTIFAKKHAKGARKVIDGCKQFAVAVEKISELNRKIKS